VEIVGAKLKPYIFHVLQTLISIQLAGADTSEVEMQAVAAKWLLLSGRGKSKSSFLMCPELPRITHERTTATSHAFGSSPINNFFECLKNCQVPDFEMASDLGYESGLRLCEGAKFDIFICISEA